MGEFERESNPWATLIKEEIVMTETEQVKLYALDATAEEDEIVEKCLLLQRKVRLEREKLLKAQQEHVQQAADNKTLREYVANLLTSANTLGLDRHGIPIAPYRTSSL